VNLSIKLYQQDRLEESKSPGPESDLTNGEQKSSSLQDKTPSQKKL